MVWDRWNFIHVLAVTNRKEIIKMKNNLMAIALLVLILSACGTPAMRTPEQTISPVVVNKPTNAPLPITPVSTSTTLVTLPTSPTSLQSTDASIPTSERIVYYYFVTTAENPHPEGSVVIMPDTYILAPALSDTTYSPDITVNLKAALKAVLNDDRNGWLSSNLEIVDVTFGNSHANVVLQGEYFGVGDVTLIAASMQILMTVFANVSVQTATVTLNEDTIGNLGVSNSMNAKPADYVFTRSEIETFINEHTYMSP
jgi:hypothetical protein